MQRPDFHYFLIRSHPANELCSALPNELEAADIECFLRVPFTAHMELIDYPIDERWFYIRKTATGFLGYRQLHQLLVTDLYHQQGSMPSNFALTIPDEKQRQVAMQTFKEDNVLDFLVIENPDLVVLILLRVVADWEGAIFLWIYYFNILFIVFNNNNPSFLIFLYSSKLRKENSINIKKNCLSHYFQK